MKALYLAIRAQIESNCPNIKHVRLYNNQYTNEANGQEIPYLKPAVFIDFPNDILWKQHGKGIQIAENLIVRLHIVHEFYNGDEQGENLAVFDIRDEVFLGVQEFRVDKATTLTRVSEKTNTDYDNIYVFLQDYELNWQESTAERPRNSQFTTPPIALVITKDLVIDNTDIRTGVLD